MLRLTKRLRAICDMVTPGSRVCDVGCDHAYVDIYLLQTGIVPGALAMDVADGPLLRAAQNLELTDLTDLCEVRKSDGLASYQAGEADTLILCGIGGILMRRILEQDPSKTASFSELVLSPQSEVHLVRGWLREKGFSITDEVFLEDEGKFYCVIKASPKGGRTLLPDWEALYLRCCALKGDDLQGGMAQKEKVCRLLSDPSFGSYAEDTFGPCVLAKFLMPQGKGGKTQSTFLQYLVQNLRAKLLVLEQLSQKDARENVQSRMQEIAGEAGILQVLLFCFEMLRDQV